MGPLGLDGPHWLTESVIDAKIARRTPGVYVLDPLDPEGVLLSFAYVGRADSDLASGLKRHIGPYRAFYFAALPSPAEAYYVECELYHHFRPADNRAHPARPP